MVSYIPESMEELIIKKCKENQSQRYATIVNKIKNITEQIKLGVEVDNNTTRPFDYLDFKLATKLTEEEFKKIAKEILPNQDLKLIYTFLAKKKVKFQQELDGKTILNINGSPYEVTEEDKIIVFNYLTNLNLGKIDRKLYMIALRRYVNGNLFIKDDKELSSKSKQSN